MKNFSAWMAKVDAVLGKMGFHSLDLPDWRYRDAFDDGWSPARAAYAALKAAKDY